MGRTLARGATNRTEYDERRWGSCGAAFARYPRTGRRGRRVRHCSARSTLLTIGGLVLGPLIAGVVLGTACQPQDLQMLPCSPWPPSPLSSPPSSPLSTSSLRSPLRRRRLHRAYADYGNACTLFGGLLRCRLVGAVRAAPSSGGATGRRGSAARFGPKSRNPTGQQLASCAGATSPAREPSKRLAWGFSS